ncbi:hypothetical protein D3C84_1294220 [compost metagenome]
MNDPRKEDNHPRDSELIEKCEVLVVDDVEVIQDDGCPILAHVPRYHAIAVSDQKIKQVGMKH